MTWSEDEIYLVMERAHALATQGLYADAAQIFAGVVSLEPGNRYAREALGSLLLILGEPVGALALAEEGLRFAPHDAALHAILAEALLALHRVADAREEVRWLEVHHPAPVATLELRLAACAPKITGPQATLESRAPITET